MECSNCKRTFASLKGLRRHQNSPACTRAQKVTKFRCQHCNKYFSYRSGLSRHKNSVCKKAIGYTELKQIKAVHALDVTGSKKKLKLNLKLKCTIASEQGSNPLSGLSKSLKKLSQQKPVLIKPKPKKLMAIANGMDNIADDILEILTVKYGDVPAIELLLTNFMSKNYIKIIDAAYLDNKSSDNYPMACSGGTHFRYINSEFELVDDADGELLVKSIINNIQNAVLMASNKLIRKYMGQNKVGDLFEVYDLGQIQKGVCDMFRDTTKKIVKRLIAKRVLNPNHQFFNTSMNFHEMQIYYHNKFN